MKCDHCGANIGLEDKVCPYCGKINPYAQQHQQQMQHYQQQFEKTRQDVEEKANRFAGIAAPLTVLVISIVILIGYVIFAAKAYDIAAAIRVRDMEKREDEFRSRIETLLDEKDFIALYEMYNGEGLYMVSSSYRSEALSDYDMIFRAAGAYSTVFEYLGDRTEDGLRHFESDRIDTYTGMIASSLMTLYTLEEQRYFDESCFAEDRLVHVHEMQDQIGSMLIAYAGFTPDEVRQIPEMSENHLEKLLTERLER